MTDIEAPCWLHVSKHGPGEVPCCLLALQPGHAPTVSKGGKVPIQEILTFKFYHEGCKC